MKIQIVWLFVFVFSSLFVDLIVFRTELTSPSFIFIGSFFICTACTMYLGDSWDIEYIDINTFLIVVISICVFLFTEQIVRFFSKVRCRNFKIDSSKITPSAIDISDTVVRFTVLLCLICIIWSLMYIVKYIGAGNWNAIMAMYKDTVNLNPEDLGFGKKILNQANKVLVALNYVFLFVYNYNSSLADYVMPRKKRTLYLTSFIEYLVFRLLLTGGRQSILFFVVAWLTMNLLCKTSKKDKNVVRKENWRYFKVLIMVVAIVFPLFYFFGRFVGRKESDVLYAATSYLATGIYGLEWEVRNFYSSNYWGEISFPNLYPLLKMLGIIPPTMNPQPFLPFFWHGNTVSLLGRWYWDFKEIGVYTMTAITATIFSYIYYAKIIYARNGHFRNIAIIVYGFLVHVLYFAGYDDFFMNLPSVNVVMTILLIAIVYHLAVVLRVKIKFKGHNI